MYRVVPETCWKPVRNPPETCQNPFFGFWQVSSRFPVGFRWIENPSLTDHTVTLIITVKVWLKKVFIKIHQKCPREFTQKCQRKFTQKEDFSWTIHKNSQKMSTRIHQKCPRRFTSFVLKNSPFLFTKIRPSTRSLPSKSKAHHIFPNCRLFRQAYQIFTQ